MKIEYIKIYLQQRAQLNQSDQNIELIVGENHISFQIGNSFLEFDITVRKNDTTNFHYDEPIRLINNAFALCFKEALLSTTIDSDIEHNKFCGQVSTIMRVISNKDGDLLSQFDNFNENDIPIFERTANLPPQIGDIPHQTLLINTRNDANKSKTKGYLYLEDIFGFCKSFEKVTKNLDFHLTLKTKNVLDILYTLMADDINVTINNLYQYVPNLILSVETQLMFI